MSQLHLLVRSVAGEGEGVAAEAAHLIVARRTIGITVTDPRRIQSRFTGAGRLIAGVQTVHHVVAPAFAGYALTAGEAGHLIGTAVVVDGQIRPFHYVPHVGRVDDLGGGGHVTQERGFVKVSVVGENCLPVVIAAPLRGDIVDGQGHRVDRGKGAKGQHVVIVIVVVGLVYLFDKGNV